MKTDKQLRHDVIAELNWEPSVIAAHIGVEVGVVTLTGHVANYAEKIGAEHAAQFCVAGVKSMAIEMDGKLAGDGTRVDSELASAAQSALQIATYFSPNNVSIKVEKAAGSR